jgi:uncharacterized protein YbjT (DUF2867 family)
VAGADTPIGISGATGYIGGRTARLLAGSGTRLALVARDPSRAPALPGATVARASYDDGDAVRRALQGCAVALMVSASEAADRLAHHLTFVDAAAAAGVRHLVYVSFYGAAPDATFTLARDHWATEEHIRASGLAYTFLRDNLYADFLPFMAGPDGVIRGPAGDGRVAAVARADIADAAAAVFADPAPHAGATYHLTGPQSVTMDEVAAILSEVTGRAVTYHAETVPEAYASRASYGAPDWQVDAWVSTYTAIANGEMAGVTDDVARLTGHPATPIAAVVG